MVCRMFDVGREDGDVEVLRFRKAKRKERSKMKHLGSDAMQGCQAQEEPLAECECESCTARLSRAQQGVS